MKRLKIVTIQLTDGPQKRYSSMNNKESLLLIVRLGIGHYAMKPLINVDWETLHTLSEEQGLSAVVLDGIEKLPDNQKPSKDLMLQWIGEVLQNYEYRCELYRRTIAELTKFYKEYGLKMMILKGYACSLDWPKPEHRPCGDIDIWQFGKQKEADELLAKEKGIKADTSHHHHTVFYWRDFMVENHYDFDNVHSHKSNMELEGYFKQFGMDDSYSVELYGEKVYIPSPNLHALFLLRHMVGHFASSNINLRQVLDWAFFVDKHTNEVDWVWLLDILKDYHMMDFFNLINGICVDDLGFSAHLFPSVQFLPDLKERVLQDIIMPEYIAEEPKGFIPRLYYKYRRWQGNAWKQRLCYNESRFELFFTGLRSHFMKPASL